MFSALLTRFQQGLRTTRYPAAEPDLPARFRGMPTVDAAKCIDQCSACRESCPTEAISVSEAGPRIDLGRCLFCNECERACPVGAIRYTNAYPMAARAREDLVVGADAYRHAEALGEELRTLLGRALRLREVSAGGCNGCEAEVNALGNTIFDAGRFGIQFVASPRHADGLLVTGPLTGNMTAALQAAYEAVPDPRIVIAVGACAISGGPFAGQSEVEDGAATRLPVDLYIPGCPPHPYTILDGLLRLLGRR